MRRHLSRLAIRLLVLALAACSSDGPTGAGGSQATDPADAWLADYLGDGVGQVDGQPFEAHDVTLRIALDADSVRLATCLRCVTVTLDSVFALTNVRVSDPIEMNLSYDVGPARYTLVLRRFSGAGGVGSAVSARATIGNAGVPTPFFDVTYILERP